MKSLGMEQVSLKAPRLTLLTSLLERLARSSLYQGCCETGNLRRKGRMLCTVAGNSGCDG